MQTSRHEAMGFSLLELMVVVGVFGILVAIAVPSVSGYLRTARVQGAASTLAADLRFARSLATSQRRTYAVTFSPDSYTVLRVSPPSPVLRRAMPQGVQCSAPDTATFFAWGLTEAATITVADDGRSSTVRLLATGSVSHD